MQLHLTIDFFDDIVSADAPWTEARLRAVVAEMAGRGVTTIRWIGHGGPASGLWDRGSYFDTRGDAFATMQRLGDPLAIVCDEAHRHGLQVLDVIKPFDMAFGVPFASHPVKHGPGTGLTHVGGEGGGAARWLRDHAHLRSRLHPRLLTDESKGPIHTIRLWHETADLARCNVQIYVSADNDTYHPYEGAGSFYHEVRKRRPPAFAPAPMERDAGVGSCSCLELTGLSIEERFVCLQPSGSWGLANDLAALLEVEDAAGNRIPYTYGLVPMQPGGQRNRTWEQGPIAHDACRLTPIPRGLRPRSSAGRFRLAGDDLPFVAFARGRNAYPTAIIDPVYPDVREWVVSLAQQSLASGADGIDLRCNTHTETLDAENYGFSQPTIDAFRERHGIDIAAQPFDRAAWRRLRGEALTALVYETAQAVKNGGGAFHLHLEPDMDRPADKSCLYETWWDWRSWLASGYVDGVTSKQGGSRTPFAEQTLAVCQEAQIPVTFSQKPNRGRLEADWLTWFRHAGEDGYAAVDLYELATLGKLNAEGRFQDAYPQLWPALQPLT